MTALVATLFYRREDPQGSTDVVPAVLVFPRRRHRRDRGARDCRFGGHRSGPRDTTAVVADVLLARLQGRFNDGGWSAGLFPLAFFGRNNGDRSHAVVFPLFWHLSDDRFVDRRRSCRSSTGTATARLRRSRRRCLFMGSERRRQLRSSSSRCSGTSRASARGTSTTCHAGRLLPQGSGRLEHGVGPLVPLLFVRSGKTASHFALVPLIWHFADRTRATRRPRSS